MGQSEERAKRKKKGQRKIREREKVKKRNNSGRPNKKNTKRCIVDIGDRK